MCPQQPKDCLRLDEAMLVKQLLPEICHFIHTYRDGHQHATDLRASASGVLFSLSCNNFNAVFSRISTRLVETTNTISHQCICGQVCGMSFCRGFNVDEVQLCP